MTSPVRIGARCKRPRQGGDQAAVAAKGRTVHYLSYLYQALANCKISFTAAVMLSSVHAA